MGLVRKSHSNRIAAPDFSRRQNDRHDTSETNEIPGYVAIGETSKQVRSERIDLLAGISQSRDLDFDFVPEHEAGTRWKIQQVETFGQNILTELARTDREPLFGELPQELCVQ